ncbi:MAG: hypothetical protein ACOX4X_09005 [Aminobacterium colombiense]
MKFVISDKHEGLVSAADRSFPRQQLAEMPGPFQEERHGPCSA